LEQNRNVFFEVDCDSTGCCDNRIANSPKGEINMKLFAVFILIVAFLSFNPLHAQENQNQFDGEWTGKASPQDAKACPQAGTYQIKIKDSEITGTFDVRVKKETRSRTDTSTVSGRVNPDGKAVLVLSPVDTDARKSKVKGTFTGTEFRDVDKNSRCALDVQLQRR
jgi:hypothetical protein